RIADHVFVIYKGRLVLEGALEDLRQNFRRMTFAFTGRAPVQEMRLPGVRRICAEGHVLAVLADGNAEEVVARAKALGAVSADVHPIGLRELIGCTRSEEHTSELQSP